MADSSSRASVGSIQSLADQGIVACQACALVEPARSCLVAASPLEPAGGVAGWLWAAEGGGEQALDLVDGAAGSGRGRAGGLSSGLAGGGAWAPVRFLQLGGGDGADREGGHDEHEVAQDRGVEPGLALVQAEAALPELESFLHWPSQACCPDQPGLGRELALGHEAVVKGQLAGLQVAADQQAVPRGGGADPGPGVPAVALGPLAGGADLPALSCPSAASSPRPRRSSWSRRRA